MPNTDACYYRRAYCDFVVWQELNLHIERITPDNAMTITGIRETLFQLCILQGKWFTRTNRKALSCVQVSDTGEEDGGTWCFCKESKGGDMVGCDNCKCPIKWFHTSCLKMKAVPKGKWMCPICHQNKRKK